MKVSVHKFGGSVLSTKKGFLNMCETLLVNNQKKIVIISALGFTSSKLKQAIFNAEIGNMTSSSEFMNSIFKEHHDLANSLLTKTQFEYFINLIDNIFSDCNKILKSVSITQELTAKTLDRFVAYGEDLALCLIKSYFMEDATTLILEARQIIKTDSNFTNANPNYTLTNENIKKYLIPNLEKYNNLIVQGFVASDLNFNTTTMGFESSNLTATIIAKFLDISELTIWTNVDGIFDSDPMLNKTAKLIQNLNYDNANYASLAGLKLIYPEMIRIAKEKNISLIFRNGINFSDKYTLISAEKDLMPTLIIIKNIKFSSNNSSYFVAEELSIKYALTLTKLKNEEYDLIQLKVINPNKSDIISNFANNYQFEIEKGTIIIYSGFNRNYLSIFCQKNLELSALINNILKLT